MTTLNEHDVRTIARQEMESAFGPLVRDIAETGKSTAQSVKHLAATVDQIDRLLSAGEHNMRDRMTRAEERVATLAVEVATIRRDRSRGSLALAVAILSAALTVVGKFIRFGGG